MHWEGAFRKDGGTTASLPAAPSWRPTLEGEDFLGQDLGEELDTGPAHPVPPLSQ